MGTFICAFVLFFGYAFGDLKLRNKSPGRSNESNAPSKRSENQIFDFVNVNMIQSLLESASCADLERRCETDPGGRKCGQGRSKEASKLIIPLLFLFQMTGVFFLALVLVKFFLLKGVFGAKIALIISGVIFARKIRQFGMLTLLRNHQLYFGDVPGQYPANEPDLSGYGYEYNFVPGFQTPEQKNNGKMENKNSAKHIK